MMAAILIVEDDPYISAMLSERLTQAGYSTKTAFSGMEALARLSVKRPDLVLLDLMLPELSGEELLPKLEGIQVIVISAKTAVADKVKLLLDGAADYLTKPFALEELEARIAVQLRTSAARSRAQLTFDDITLDEALHTVTAADKPVKLTRTEYAILKLLLQNQQQVVTKTQILLRIAEDTPDCTETTLKGHISHLRHKLRQASGKDYIEAVWGIGFKLSDL